MIIGIGIDSIEPYRIERAVRKYGKRFLKKIYTSEEQRRCERGKHIYQNYAGNFTAKEAMMKVLETGGRPMSPTGVSFLEIELYNEASGAPRIRLYGKAKRIADEKGINKIGISITSLEAICTACVIGEKIG